LDSTERSDVGFLPQDLALMRVNFMLEELSEYAACSGLVLTASRDGEVAFKIEDPTISAYNGDKEELEGACDGLIDLLYVLAGTMRFHGLHMPCPTGRSYADEMWTRVQRANLTKVRATSDGKNSKRKSGFDVVKPIGFVSPTFKDLL
jgi:predicted HAD superfamily Cof-like phosphohydrolase